MKLIYHESTQIPLEEIHIHAHPANQDLAQSLTLNKQIKQLTLVNPVNNRQYLCPLHLIESFEANGHYCEVQLLDDRRLIFPQRLKQLTGLLDHRFCQINQSQWIQWQAIESFTVERHARLQLISTSQRKYMVSRHYAKFIKERVYGQ